MQYRWLVFDLGGVLAPYTGLPALKRWMGREITDAELSRLWLFSENVRAFESGKMEFQDYADAVIAELDMKVSSSEFMSALPDFITGFYPGVKELLTELSKDYSLAMLSNTNQPHWDKLKQESVISLFEHLFLSFKTGLLKPDSAAYINVIETLQCEPAQIVFFDDNIANIEEAQKYGICAIHVTDFEDLQAKTKGMIPL